MWFRELSSTKCTWQGPLAPAEALLLMCLRHLFITGTNTSLHGTLLLITFPYIARNVKVIPKIVMFLLVGGFWGRITWATPTCLFLSSTLRLLEAMKVPPESTVCSVSIASSTPECCEDCDICSRDAMGLWMHFALVWYARLCLVGIEACFLET